MVKGIAGHLHDQGLGKYDLSDKLKLHFESFFTLRWLLGFRKLKFLKQIKILQVVLIL